VTALASSASFRKRARASRASRASRVPSGPLLVVTAALLWGTVGPAAALAGSQLSAVVLGGWRQALGGAVLVLPSLARGRHRELVALARSRAVLAAAAATGVFQVLFLYAVAQVESAWGAVSALPPVRFPRPLAEPGVRLSPHRALHGHCRQALAGRVQGLGIVLPR